MFTSRNCRKMVASLSSAFMLSSALVLAGSGHGIAYAAEEKTSGFLSEGEAVRFAKKWVEIPDRYEQIFAYYITPEDADVSSPAWNLGWGVGEKLEEKQAMYIRIHPSTGKLLSYLFQPTENGDGILAKPVSKEKARENVERFMSRAVSDDERPKLSKPAESVYEKEGKITTYTFIYFRVENNIPFNQNWIRVRANSSGEIVEFKRNWYEGELPDARLAIPEELARNTLEKGREPSLLYRKMGKGTGSDGKIRDEYRLVYDYRKTDPQLVDAITGRVIDAGGNEVTSKTQLRILENENPASIPLAANEHKVALTQEQAISSAIKLVQSSFRGQLKNIYLVEPPPPQWSMEDLFKHQIDYEVEFGWLEGGIIIQDATFQVRVHPGTGQAHFVDEEPVRAPAIVDKSPKRVHVSVAKQTEQANKTLELVYYQPSGYGENGKPRLIYRLTGDYGVVDARNGEWLSFK